MHSTCFSIGCITNLHAGSGDSGIGIIDKMVQRDAVTLLPVIYASTLKGAFREYFEEGPRKSSLSQLAEAIFGKNTKDSAGNGQKGSHVFHEAQILALPVGSNLRPFFMVTSKENLLSWLNKAKLFGAKLDEGLEKEINDLPLLNKGGAPLILGGAIPGLIIDDHENVGASSAVCTNLRALIGESIVLMNHDDFKAQCSDYSLPVIARNQLENGESQNLWYEQIVPHQSIFSFFVYNTDDKTPFADNVNNAVVQIGANSSLGYGYCEIKKI